jgi:SAM-dependent methyltransferase
MQRCPICAALAELWCRAGDHHYGNPGLWDVYRCSHCRHLFQNPLPKEEDLVQFYPASYYAYQQPKTDFAPRGLRHRGVWLRLHYLKYFRGYQHLTVCRNPILASLGCLLNQRPLHFDSPVFQRDGAFLDYGSGTGGTVAFAQYTGWRAEGIEINATAAQIGRESGLRIDNGSIEALEDRPGRYNYIVSSHSVEHVADVCRLFRAFFKALKPGGVLAIDVPNADAISVERFRAFSFYLGMPVHVNLFTPTSMRLLARSTGFVDISTATYSRWSTQAESAVLIRRSQNGRSVPAFHSHGKWKGFLGRIKSLPAYILSRTQSRGDCLVMTCVKPLSQKG